MAVFLNKNLCLLTDAVHEFQIDVMSIDEKSNTEYFLEVDLEYHDKLYELQNYYPLAPEKFAASNNMLSKYCKKIAGRYEIEVGDVKKIIPNLGNKTKYVLHYRNLQLYLSLGKKLTKFIGHQNLNNLIG